MKKLVVLILIISITFIGTQVKGGQNIPLQDSVLRLHVLANSDSLVDQALKLEVKDYVVKYMQKEFRDTGNLAQACSQVEKELPNIKMVAQEVITSHGYDYPVEVVVGTYDFPTKSYGNLIFPAGDYQALRIIIGEGQGKNWWCVLFPPLCLVSSSDKGLSLESPTEAKISLKCLELLPKGVKVGKE